MKCSKMQISAFLLCSITLLFTGCSGTGESGSSSGAITLSALILPEKLSVVDPQTSGTSSKPLPGKPELLMAGITGTAPPVQTDYESDRVTVYVNERSLESFATVNEILCMLRQSRYDAMINKGTYIAQVDKNLCSSNRDNAAAGQQTADQSSGAAMPVYETWTVNSFRASSQSPHIVKAWVHSVPDKPDDPETVIHAKVMIEEGADTAPPYGIFKANFKALDKETQTVELFKGFLDAERDPAGQVLLKFSTEDKDSYFIERATLDKSTDGKTVGSVFKVISLPTMTPQATRFNIAYDETNFKRVDNFGNKICLDRASPPDISAWRYALYNEDGSRVRRNSGFPVKIGDTYGWIGYWGAWFPGIATPEPGALVLKHDYSTNSDTAYTLVRAGGKLKKHTRRETNLGAIKNIPLVWWDESGNTYQVVWDGAGMNIVGELVSNNDGETWHTIAYPFDLAHLSWFELGFWSQPLGGMVIVKFPPPLDVITTSTATPSSCGYNTDLGEYDCSPPAATDSVKVIYYTENIIYPDDNVPPVLACFNNCPDVNTLSTNAPFRSEAEIASYQSVTPDSSTYAAYRFDNAGMILYSGASGTIPVITATTGTDFPGGVTSGPLFDPALLSAPSITIPSPLGCDWARFSETCGGKAWSVLPVFYTWETGPNEWNMFTGLQDAYGNPVKFEPPLQVEYTHKLADKYQNTKFYLQYAGFGDLQGIPGKCVNVDTGQDGVDCSGGDPAVKWVPEFSIPDIDPLTQSFTTMTDVLNGTVYLVKALEKEQRMKIDLTPGACDGLDAQPYKLPDMSSYIDPVIGTEPIVSGAPSVIGGVVQ